MKFTEDKKQRGNSILTKQSANIVMAIIAFVLTSLAIITGSYVSDTENVEIGTIAGKRYVATRNVENTLATQVLQDEAAAQVGPLYKHNPEIEENAIASIEEYFITIDQALEEMVSNTDKINANALESQLEDGTAPLEYNFDLQVTSELPVAISQKQTELYYDLTVAGKTQFKDEIISMVSSFYEQRITDENIERIITQAEETADGLLWQQSLKELASAISVSALVPNLTIDEEAIEAAKEQRIADVEPVMVLKDQKIVDEGEMVTEEAYYILDELGLINISYNTSVLPLIGSVMIVLIGFIIICFYMNNQNKKLINEKNKTFVIFVIYVINILIMGITANIKSYYFIPVSLFAMLISVLIKPKMAIFLNCFVSLFSLFIFNENADFLVYSLVVGSFSALLVQYTNKRTKMILVYALIGAVHMVTYLGVNMFFVKDISILALRESLYATLVGVISVIIVVGSLPLWESVFGIDTHYKLLELSNPNNEIMKRLMIEAPGTYHHSLVVANLAETAAYDIYANGALARVGAYYHDIGKLTKPQCFSENQFGVNIHDTLDPSVSAKVIIDHVSDGVEIAKKENVPKTVRDIVEQHHGTSLVKYFYYKSTQEKTEMETIEEDFKYKGPIPQTKESGIVMLADTVEAAVRSSLGKERTVEDVSNLIDSLFKDKLDNGQLNDCRLDLKELQIIKSSFMKVFNGMYHDRIAYPKAEEIEAARQAQLVKKLEDET